MKTEQELNNDILKIKKAIEFMYPHLSKYLGEYPVPDTDAASSGKAIINLNVYYDSLDVFFKYYTRYDNSLMK
jgi:hypothetical protein